MGKYWHIKDQKYQNEDCSQDYEIKENSLVARTILEVIFIDKDVGFA